MAVFNHPDFPKLVALCTLNTFIRVDNVPTIKHSGPYSVVLSVAPAIADLVVSKEPVNLGLLKFYYLTSLNITCGFLFEFPRLDISVKRNYIKVRRKDYDSSNAGDTLTPVAISFANKDFTVFTSGDSSALITVNKQSYTNQTEK